MPNVIIYGSSGALGRALVSLFKTKSWNVVGIDLFQNPEANSNIILDPKASVSQQAEAVLKSSELSGASKNSFDALLCVSGGWVGGNAASEGFIDAVDLSLRQSVYPSVIAASLACKHLKRGGLVVFSGASAALNGTPGMIAYGLAKASVHHLVGSLGMEGSGLPENAKAIGILPVALDTPANRAAMPDADHSSWTPLSELSEAIFEWANNHKDVKNGQLVEVVTTKGKTRFLL
ncbi:hypothetical protein BB558_003788 [Smittium angustum]|uniref:Dihydropteridine reductase n=1 Tax=Smittium angustum TaxID=133377 RepID=A0A2U1J530_SMIAN|nr:hypothetical protein BB558_003788 [Smittium angustum]